MLLYILRCFFFVAECESIKSQVAFGCYIVCTSVIYELLYMGFTMSFETTYGHVIHLVCSMRTAM